MSVISATGAERLSLDFQPVAKTGAALFLSKAPATGTRIDDRLSERNGGTIRPPPARRRRWRQHGFVGFGTKGEQIVRRLGGGTRRTHDGAIVLAQHLEPRTDVIGVAHRRHDAERGAHEGAASSRRGIHTGAMSPRPESEGRPLFRQGLGENRPSETLSPPRAASCCAPVLDVGG